VIPMAFVYMKEMTTETVLGSHGTGGVGWNGNGMETCIPYSLAGSL
jgi:hypothetical protein